MLKSFITFFFALIIIINSADDSFAASIARNKKSIKKNIVPIETALVLDVRTGKVLYSKNPRAKIHPASLVKLMTLHLAFEALQKGTLRLNQKLYISEHASSMQPCKMGLPAGDFITTEAAILSLVVGSHNDIAVVLAENIGGSEERFARLMTKTARELGMKNTSFQNASGLHHNKQTTTALDLVKLSLAIKTKHPKFYPLLARTSFTYRDKIYTGHNHVMKTYPHAKASKTGFTTPSGYNLITHATLANKDIIAVVTGYKSAVDRNKRMVVLLDKHLGVNKITTASAKLQSFNNKKVKLAANTNNKKRINKRTRRT